MVDPSAKRRRKDDSSHEITAGPSQPKPAAGRLFAPFRALGYVTNHVPFSMFVHTPKGALAKPTINIVTSVGRSWMMWDAARMTLVFVGKEAEEEIKSLAMTGTEVYASMGSRIRCYERGKEVSVRVSRSHSMMLI